MRIIILLGAVTISAALSGAQASRADSNSIAPGLGHDLAERLCSSCHLIEPGASNPVDHVGGPAFQTVANRPGVTERSLRRHLRTTHSNTMIPLAMPNPQLSEDELVKIISYILSLRRP